jgi:hypothetical protein
MDAVQVKFVLTISFQKTTFRQQDNIFISLNVSCSCHYLAEKISHLPLKKQWLTYMAHVLLSNPDICFWIHNFLSEDNVCKYKTAKQLYLCINKAIYMFVFTLLFDN